MALREVLAHFGITVDSDQVDKADKRVKKTTDRLKDFANAIGGSAIVYGVSHFIKQTAEIGARIDDNATRLGIGTDALQELGFAASQSGSNAEELTAALFRLEDMVGDTLREPTGATAKAFKALGVSVKDGAGHTKEADEVLADVADGLLKLKSPSEQASAVMSLFGRQGRSLLPMLKEGRGGIEKLREEFKKLGGGYSQDGIKATREFDDATDRLATSLLSLRSRVAIQLLPMLQRLVDAVAYGGAQFVKFTENTNLMKSALLVATVAAGAMLLPFLKTALIIGALIVVVDELITLFDGGETVIGDFIDKIAGKTGTALEITEHLKVAWESVKEAAMEAADAIAYISGATPPSAAVSKNDIKATRERQRREAVAGGGTIRFKGEDPQIANAQNARVAQDIASEKRYVNLATGFDYASFLGVAPRKMRGQARGGEGAPAVNTSVVVNVNQPGATADEIGHAVKRETERSYRQAADALVPNAVR